MAESIQNAVLVKLVKPKGDESGEFTGKKSGFVLFIIGNGYSTRFRRPLLISQVYSLTQF